MLFTLIRKEIVSNVLSLRFVVTLVLFFSLIQISVFTLVNQYEKDAQTYAAGAAAQRERLQALSKYEDFNRRFRDNILYDEGVFGSLIPQPLSVFVRGLVDRLPAQVNTSLRNEKQSIDENFYRNPLFGLFATPDFGYIVNIVVSLQVLLFVFDAISGEKERGTLKLILANSIPRDTVLLGKWIGGYISLATPFIIAMLGSVIVVFLSGAIQYTDDIQQRLMWIFAVSLLYVSLFFALGMLISTLTHRASTALIVALFVWVCWVLVIPNLAPVAARMISPLPSRNAIAGEKLAIAQEGKLLLRNYGKKGKREQMEPKVWARVRHEQQLLDRFYESKLRTQTDLSKTLSRISPSSSFTYAVGELANTGIGLFDNFKKAQRRFRDEYRDWGEQWDKKYRSEKLAENWLESDPIPTLTMTVAGIDDSVEAVWVDVLLMLVFTVLFFMLSYVFFLRYDVT